MPPFGELFLHKKDSKLHTSDPVAHEYARQKQAGEHPSQKPADKLHAWMEVLKHTHEAHHDDPRVFQRILDWYHAQYVIADAHVPESYFENQKRLARERGHGDIDISEEQKQQLIEILQSDQKSTLDVWLSYLASPDAASIPTWAKYWAFTGMLKLSTFDKETHTFGKRTATTTAPFPDLNREALAYVIDAIVQKANQTATPPTDADPAFAELLTRSNFGDLYAWAIEKVTPTEQNELLTTEGVWKKYQKCSDHMPLVQSLQGYGTGWCTAGESTAHTQLQGGDFYVYYSYNHQGQPVIPRVAIRMEEDAIGEVRGIAPDQNLDPYITEVVTVKLKEFPDGAAYEQKTADMQQLTALDTKVKHQQPLTDADLRFLYEIDRPIKGFGYQKDPRIAELLNNRDIKEDLAYVFHCAKNQISTTTEEALSGNAIYHTGYLDLRSLTSVEGLTLPQSIGQSLSLDSLTSAEGLTLPQSIGGYLDLCSLTSVKDLIIPESFDGTVIYFSKHLPTPEKEQLRLQYSQVKFVFE